MRVLGIDPGTGNCGFAVLDADDGGQAAIRDLGTFRSDADDRLRDRVHELVDDVLEIVDAWKPQVLVAESPNFPEGKVAAVMTWSAYTTLVAVCKARGIDLVVRTPGEWRKLLGLPTEKTEKVNPHGLDEKELKRARGRASRAAKARRKAGTVALMLARFPSAPLLLRDAPNDSHEHAWDALAIATSWTDRATETPKQAAQAALFTP